MSPDPPYFVFAYQLRGRPGSEFPPGIGIDFPDAGTWRDVTIAGKQVIKGEPAMMDQTEHARGTPYVWNSSSVHYLVVTEDDAWAEEALRALTDP